MAATATIGARRHPRLSRAGTPLLLGIVVAAGLSLLGVPPTGGGSGVRSGWIASAAAASRGDGTTTTTSSEAASVGYDGPAICAPTTDAATSGGSPRELTTSAKKVATGTIEGRTWSLWSADGQSGAAGLEDGGLVFDGREYGVCAGYPNPSESEMIDTGRDAVMYGVVDYPGLAKVQISTGALNSLAVGTVLPPPHVSVVDGVSFYIGTLPKTACSYSYFEINTTSPSYSTEHNIGFGGDGAGQGYAITNNPGNTGACVTGKLDPLSYSEGEWQLPPGQFESGFGAGVGLGFELGLRLLELRERSERHLDVFPDDRFPRRPAGRRAPSPPRGPKWPVGPQTASPGACGPPRDQSGALGIEDGGLVLGGRAYGLCPGYPNPAELQLIDVGSNGVVAGVVGYPGPATVDLSESSAGTFDVGQALPSPTVEVVDGVSFFIGTLPKSACDYSSLELNTTSPGVSAQHNLGFGTCIAGQLVPITESQGIWQLPPGHFQSSF